VTAGAPSWNVSNVKNVVGDFDRDGRDDVMAFMRDGSGSRVVALRSKGDGTFADPQQLWAGNVSFDDTTPFALDVSPDSVADIALVNTSTNRATWLRGVERFKTTAASMVHMGDPYRQDAAFTSAAKPF
jgi:hypothetical protein